jgi:hypothetical protein
MKIIYYQITETTGECKKKIRIFLLRSYGSLLWNSEVLKMKRRPVSYQKLVPWHYKFKTKTAENELQLKLRETAINSKKQGELLEHSKILLIN